MRFRLKSVQTVLYAVVIASGAYALSVPFTPTSAPVVEHVSTLCGSCKIQRSPAARREFVKANPCPATKKPGACDGWQVDHRVPLCAGGPDSPKNLQWLTVRDHREKTKKDLKMCRSMRK